MQIKEILDTDYYNDYDVIYGEDKKEGKTAYPKELLDYYDRNFAKIRELVVGDHVLDIGCAAGEMLYLLKKYFLHVYGIEPSKNLAKRAAIKGFSVLNDGFSKDVYFQHKFDVITCLMVLEHINSLNDFIETVYDNLTEGGIVMINVPNGTRIFETQSYYDVYPEHINYFTEKSIMELTWKHGLEMMHLEESFGNGYHLTVFLRKPYKNILFSEKKEEDIADLNAILQREKVVGVWGIGVRARNIINLIKEENLSRIKYLFDRNAAVEGKKIPNVNLPITMPGEEKVKECSLIVVSSLEYCDQIISTLREQYRFEGKICYVKERKFCLY